VELIARQERNQASKMPPLLTRFLCAGMDLIERLVETGAEIASVALLQLGVLRFGFLQRGKIRIGLFAETK